MKIASIDIITVVVPTIPGRVHSASFGPAGWDEVPKHIIRLNTDDGIYGLGETSRGTPEGAIQQGFNQLKGRDPLKLSLQNVFIDAAMHRNTAMPFRDVVASEDGGGTRDWESLNGWGTGAGYEAFEWLFLTSWAKFEAARSTNCSAVRTEIACQRIIGSAIKRPKNRLLMRGSVTNADFTV